MARQVAGAVTFPAGVAVGVGVGGAVSGAIEPRLRALQNEAWARFKSMPLEAAEAAQLVADGERSMEWGKAEAENMGVNGDRFEALVDMIDTAPDLATLRDMLHRGFIDADGFADGARRNSIEQRWIPPLLRLQERILSPAEAANAWQQGYMSEAEAEAEAELSGVNARRALIQRELAGLPPGPETGLEMLRRGIIGQAEFEQMIVEGNTKRKYADEYLALRSRILSATTAASLWLKGWVSEGEAKAIGAANGFDAAAMDRIYQDRGRPATVRQAHIGFARGGRLPGAGNNEKQTIRRSVEESNIRSEWFDILYAQRFTYPSAFVVRALASDGTFPQALTETILIESGWKPEWARLASEKWAEADGGSGTKWSDRARSRLFTTAHNEYMDGSLGEAEARTLLGRVGAAAAEQRVIIGLWNAERGIIETELTAAQVRQAYARGRLTIDEANARLTALGYSPANAAIFLGLEPPELSPAEIRREYAKAVITLDQAVVELTAQGYTDADARAYLADARPELSARDIKDAFQNSVIDEATARVRLQALGYPDADIDILIATWTPPPETP